MPEILSAAALPLLLLGAAIPLLISRRRAALFDAFLAGAREGLRTTVSLLPTLVLLLTAVSMLTASGVSALLARLLTPLGEALGVPAGLLPLFLVRPVSGSASGALLSDLFDTYGPDSFTGLCASVLLGSSDTLVYILAVYFAAAKVRRTRYAFPCAVAAAVFTLLLSCAVCRLLYGEGGL